MKRKRADIAPHTRSTEYPTLTKPKVQGAVEFLEAKGLLKKTGWNEHVTQAFVNKQVQGMEDRIHDLLDGDSRMTAH